MHPTNTTLVHAFPAALQDAAVRAVSVFPENPRTSQTVLLAGLGEPPAERLRSRWLLQMCVFRRWWAICGFFTNRATEWLLAPKQT